VCAQLIPSEEDEPGQQWQQHDRLISLTTSTHSPAQTAKSSAAVDHCVSCRSGWLAASSSSRRS